MVTRELKISFFFLFAKMGCSQEIGIWDYDLQGNVISEIGAEGDYEILYEITYINIYDENNNLVEQKTDWNNDGTIDNVTIYTYDTSNNLTKEESSEIDGPVEFLTTYTYDDKGNVITEKFEDFRVIYYGDSVLNPLKKPTIGITMVLLMEKELFFTMKMKI